MMLKIEQFRYDADNLAYLIFGKSEAMAVDGGAVTPMLAFLRKRGLALTYVTHTHNHPDHTVGTRELLDRTGAVFMDHRILAERGRIAVEDQAIAVLHTPGHTEDAVTFAVGNALVTGDTLFNGTVGNCFSGDLLRFFHSIKRLMRFPETACIYAGHDYVAPAMTFARTVEPANTAIDGYLAKYDPQHVCTTLGDELKVNPYLRFNAEPMIRVLQEKGLAVGTEYERWQSLMSLE